MVSTMAPEEFSNLLHVRKPKSHASPSIKDTERRRRIRGDLESGSSREGGDLTSNPSQVIHLHLEFRRLVRICNHLSPMETDLLRTLSPASLHREANTFASRFLPIYFSLFSSFPRRRSPSSFSHFLFLSLRVRSTKDGMFDVLGN